LWLLFIPRWPKRERICGSLFRAAHLLFAQKLSALTRSNHQRYPAVEFLPFARPPKSEGSSHRCRPHNPSHDLLLRCNKAHPRGMLLDVHPRGMLLDVHPRGMILDVHPRGMLLGIRARGMLLGVHPRGMLLDVHPRGMLLDARHRPGKRVYSPGVRGWGSGL